jgi:tetrahydromethanopterin S-methyltransferase subunit G
MLDDKVMDLLGKILENQTETNSQLKELTSRVQKIESKVENDSGYKIKALFDAREVQNEKNDTIINALERIETKIEILQMETAHVRKVQ